MSIIWIEAGFFRLVAASPPTVPVVPLEYEFILPPLSWAIVLEGPITACLKDFNPAGSKGDFLGTHSPLGDHVSFWREPTEERP
jgi:hypothetical protein